VKCVKFSRKFKCTCVEMNLFQVTNILIFYCYTTVYVQLHIMITAISLRCVVISHQFTVGRCHFELTTVRCGWCYVVWSCRYRKYRAAGRVVCPRRLLITRRHVMIVRQHSDCQQITSLSPRPQSQATESVTSDRQYCSVCCHRCLQVATCN